MYRRGAPRRVSFRNMFHALGAGETAARLFRVSTRSHLGEYTIPRALERMGHVYHPRRMLRMCTRHDTPAGISMLQWWPSEGTGATWLLATPSAHRLPRSLQSQEPRHSSCADVGEVSAASRTKKVGLWCRSGTSDESALMTAPATYVSLTAKPA